MLGGRHFFKGALIILEKFLLRRTLFQRIFYTHDPMICLVLTNFYDYVYFIEVWKEFLFPFYLGVGCMNFDDFFRERKKYFCPPPLMNKKTLLSPLTSQIGAGSTTGVWWRNGATESDWRENWKVPTQLRNNRNDRCLDFEQSNMVLFTAWWL